MRESAEVVKKLINTPLKVVEIGVGAGDNAVDMLKNLNIEQLYLVDPYDAYNDPSIAEEEKIDYQQLMLKNIEPFSKQVTTLTINSVEAAATFEDNSLDYVYIDGLHEEENVMADILAWYPKVKIGGILGGHDYLDCHGSDPYPGVTKAVQKFVKENNLVVSSNSGPGGTDWYIQK